jgi:hypothetical protein
MRIGIRLAAVMAALVVVCVPAVALADDAGVAGYVVTWINAMLAPVLAALGAWLAAEAIRWLRAHVKHTQSRDALERAVHAIGAAVGEVQQTFVDELKAASADGKLTASEAHNARDRALLSAKEYLGPKGLDAIRAVIGTDENALDHYLIALIETRIADSLSFEPASVAELKEDLDEPRPPTLTRTIPTAIVLLAVFGLASCTPSTRQVADSAVEVVDAACTLGLVDAVAVQVGAADRDIPVEVLAELLCSVPEVYEAFVLAQGQRTDPAVAAVLRAREMGLL